MVNSVIFRREAISFIPFYTCGLHFFIPFPHKCTNNFDIAILNPDKPIYMKILSYEIRPFLCNRTLRVHIDFLVPFHTQRTSIALA
uniref:Uncharacterized protein n=1 Tax=Candidatus Kentrum sp. SD TaxID=2126332 RepID=A0A450Z5F4_9GAMM|nr:MAG: hypothetical protein BECKSD772F_GA0070984_11508 [Candidatus Kentron sp. SD]VFK49050.1 MAG: hypothetical protein BECKSD772E_GA0070983_11558 [Candidatus Kentron sp. SD]